MQMHGKFPGLPGFFVGDHFQAANVATLILRDFPS